MKFIYTTKSGGQYGFKFKVVYEFNSLQIFYGKQFKYFSWLRN